MARGRVLSSVRCAFLPHVPAQYCDSSKASSPCHQHGLIHKCIKVKELSLRKASLSNALIERALTKWTMLQSLTLVTYICLPSVSII